MVIGLDKFSEHFKAYQDCYLIIGGSACDIIIEGAGFVPRATMDIDIILMVEALKPEFVKHFWDFIRAGNYKTREKNQEKRNCYRFAVPETAGYPKQIELFSKVPDAIDLHEDAHLTPIPVGEGLSSLSAILLDEHYYDFTKKHSVYADGVHRANPEALICLKAFAYLDNKKRKEAGAEIPRIHIIKHKNDVFRMIFMLKPDDTFELPEIIKSNLQEFADTVKNDLPDPAIFKANGFGEQSMATIYQQLVKIFGLNA